MYSGMESAYGRAQRYTYQPHKSLYYSSFGKISMEPSSFRRHHFIAAYRSRLASEWSPTMRARPIPPLASQPQPIYLSSMGMLPHYAGHIPGGKYRFGQTFTNDSKDVKVWLRLVKPH